MGHAPADDDVGATRIPDEAGHVPADRSLWDVRSPARGNSASDQRVGTSNGSQQWLTAVKLRRSTRAEIACRLAGAITCVRQPTPAYCAFAASRVAALRLRLPLTLATALPHGSRLMDLANDS